MYLVRRYTVYSRGAVTILKQIKTGYLTVTQAAERWGKTTSTVRLWCSKGLIAGAYKKSPHAWLIPAYASMPIVPQGYRAQARYRARP